jgi:hypothetical protein
MVSPFSGLNLRRALIELALLLGWFGRVDKTTPYLHQRNTDDQDNRASL